MDFCDLAPTYIRSLAPYQPGKPISELERELGISNIIKLASNENPLGISPRAKQALLDEINTLALYPDGNGFVLKDALSKKYGVGLEQIVLGNGSNDVLDLVARAFLAPGVSAVFSQHAFAVYPISTQAVGATGIKVPAVNYGHDLDAMLAAIRDDTRVVFVANPNNPTGTYLGRDELRRFVEKVPAHVVVVVDEAYNEYLPPELKIDTASWIAEFPNLVVVRTFSKAYGLAGLRVGFGLADPRVADLMNRVRQPFNVNNLALVAAVAALGDEGFVRESYELNRKGMAQLVAGFEQLGVEFIPSFGNFISFKVGDGNAVYQSLLRLGVIVRPIGGYEMPGHLRVTIGLPSENERFLAALAQVIGERR